MGCVGKCESDRLLATDTDGGFCWPPQLKSAVADVEELAGKDDRYFLKWLRARKFHLAKAEDMLRKVSESDLYLDSLSYCMQQHIETRKKYKLDTILTDYEPNEVEHPLQEN